MTKGEEHFKNDRPQLIKNFLDEVNGYTRIYAYEVQDNGMVGTHIGKDFLRNHLDLFEPTGFWHVVDDEVYEDDNGYEHLYEIIGYGIIIKDDKLEEFKGYSSVERLS